MRARDARCAVSAAASAPAAAGARSGRLGNAAGATLNAPWFPSAGTTPAQSPCPVLPSPARLAPRLDMEGATVLAAGDGPAVETGLPGSPREAAAEATAAPAEPRKPHGVKRHHHKHNLKHRYELQETLGKGTYGKVKRAIERFSGRVVSKGNPWGGGFPASSAADQVGVWAYHTTRASSTKRGLRRSPPPVRLSFQHPMTQLCIFGNTCYILSAHILGAYPHF